MLSVLIKVPWKTMEVNGGASLSSEEPRPKLARRVLNTWRGEGDFSLIWAPSKSSNKYSLRNSNQERDI